MYVTVDFSAEVQANIIRQLFHANGNKEQIVDEGLILFILLELVHSEKVAVRCMSVKQSGSKHRTERCAGEIKSSELCSNMIDLFHAVRDPRLYGENLVRKIYQVVIHFLCSRHRKIEFAEQLTINWLPLIQQYRELYPLPTFVPGQDLQLLYPMFVPQPHNGQAPFGDVKPIVLPNVEAVYLTPEEQARLTVLMAGEAHGLQN